MTLMLLLALGCANTKPSSAPAEATTTTQPAPVEGNSSTDNGSSDNGSSDNGSSNKGSADKATTKTPPAFGGNVNVAGDPVGAYEKYRDRLEGPEAEGECSSDADCARAGCSSEVCTTAAKAAEINTTCEVLPVYTVLDACGCVDTRCQWSIKQ